MREDIFSRHWVRVRLIRKVPTVFLARATRPIFKADRDYIALAQYRVAGVSMQIEEIEHFQILYFS